MIDWHCHILPHMDDGSRNVEESLTLLKMLSEQGVDTAVATPHFYADDETVDEFVNRRQRAYEKLSEALCDASVKILTGAEVRYYSGISRLAGLEKLCIGDTDLLLLEMPMERWTEYTVRELVDIAGGGKVRLVLAHIDRYLTMQPSGTWQRLYEAGITMQVNGSFFEGFWTKRKAFSLLEKGGVHLIGSDCHNVRYRPPRLDKTYEKLRKKFGDELVTQLNEHGRSLLDTKFEYT